MLRQFTTGLLGWSGLCSFTCPLIWWGGGGGGFRLMYFHLLSRGISVLLSFTVFLIWAWNTLVGSVGGHFRSCFCVKILYFTFVLLYGEYGQGVTFVCSYYHSLIVTEFSFHVFYLSGFGVCVMYWAFVLLYAISYHFPVDFPFIVSNTPLQVPISRQQ